MRAAALLCALAAFAPAQDEAAADPQTEAERLFTVATSGSPRIRYQAALRLASLGESGAALVRAQLDQPDGYLALGPALYEALPEFHDPALRAALWSTLADDRNPWRPAAARALAKSPTLDEAARFQGLTRDRVSAVRAEAITGVSAGEASHAIHALTPLLADANGRVRRRAAAALSHLDQHTALAYLVEDLRRDDTWFNMRLGRIARAEAAQALSKLLGREALDAYTAREAPDTPANTAAIRAIAARCRERAGDTWPELPTIARAPGTLINEIIGIELRSCRYGEHLLRWTADDRLVLGEGDTHSFPLPAGSAARLLAHAKTALKSLGDARIHGDPGCDLERYHIRLPGAARAITIQLTKGPDAVPDLRPEALQALAAAMIESTSQTDNGERYARLIALTFEGLGGPLPD
jgi:HEAT repeat protein